MHDVKDHAIDLLFRKINVLRIFCWNKYIKLKHTLIKNGCFHKWIDFTKSIFLHQRFIPSYLRRISALRSPFLVCRGLQTASPSGSVLGSALCPQMHTAVRGGLLSGTTLLGRQGTPSQDQPITEKNDPSLQKFVMWKEFIVKRKKKPNKSFSKTSYFITHCTLSKEHRFSLRQ